MWLMSLSQHMSKNPKIFKVYFSVRNLNRGTYIITEFNRIFIRFFSSVEEKNCNSMVTWPINSFATLKTRRELEPKCAPQFFLGLFLGTCRSAIGHFFLSPNSPCKSWHDHVSFLKWRKKKEENSCLGLLFGIPESLHGEISLDKVLIQRPDWNQGDCESDS